MDRKEKFRAALHPFLKGGILLAFAWYILRLKVSGSLGYYLAPHLENYAGAAALMLYALAVFQFYCCYLTVQRYASADSCDCTHASRPKRALYLAQYTLLAASICLGLVLPDELPGSGLASVKGMTLQPGQSLIASDRQPFVTPEGQSLDELFDATAFSESYAKFGRKLYLQHPIAVGDESFIETLTTLDYYRAAFIGKEVSIEGFVYRSEGLPGNQIMIARLALQCCAADASVYGLLAETPHAPSYADDVWVKVRGELAIGEVGGYEVLRINVTSIERIAPLEDPYVYPNYEFDL